MKKGTVSFEKAVNNFDEFTTNLIIASGLLTLMKWLKEKEVRDMLAKKEYYKIIVKNNETATVYKIEYDEYKEYQNNFYYVYHTKNGDTYPMHQNFDACIDMLIVVDDGHLNELLYDLREQGFCDTIEFKFIDDYFNGNYKQYGKAF